VSTPAPLSPPDTSQRNAFQPETAADSTGAQSAHWKQELNARLHQHRQRRIEAARSEAARSEAARSEAARVESARPESAQFDFDATPSPQRRRSTAAERAAARVAERYSRAPSYQELLAASAVAAAAAAESAAEAAAEAHAVLSDVLSEWSAAQPQPGTHSGNASSLYRDVFDDPFFSTPRQAAARETQTSEPVPGNAGSHNQAYDEPALSHAAVNAPSSQSPASTQGAITEPAPPPARRFADLLQQAIPHHAALPPLNNAGGLSVEHPHPLPPRTLLPTRRLVVERARSLVDAFAEAVVPAAQSLPAKLIEFPRELVATRRQRPRLAEGPLAEPPLGEAPAFDQESPGIALRIFEVETAATIANPAATPAPAQPSIMEGNLHHWDTRSSEPVASPASGSLWPQRNAAENPRHTLAESPAEQRFRSTPATDSPMPKSNSHNDDQVPMPRRRGGFLFGTDARRDNASDSAPDKAPETGWGTIRLGEHPEPFIDSPSPPIESPLGDYSPVDSPFAVSALPEAPIQSRYESQYESRRESRPEGLSASQSGASYVAPYAYPREAVQPAADRPLSTPQLRSSAVATPVRQKKVEQQAKPDFNQAAVNDADPANAPLHGLAPLSDRCMSALIDGILVAACFLLSVLVFTACTTHPPSGRGALAIAGIVLGALATFYGWLFMSYGGGSTPGMRYARIALCSFADDNPTRKELQNRIPATALALLPLGLGLIWALMDEDKLGWHDRMTRTYQRSYR
jgi:uncharacterized RDD family membrane protein YckC